MKGLMIAAMESGSGKTALTCALLTAMKRRGMDVQAFKCGPDYIDPMFHTKALGIPSRNLDLFLQGADGVLETLGRSGSDYAVMESAMGFYDGIGGTSEASAWAVADSAGTPVLLVVRPKGASLTLAAQIKGLLSFRRPSRIVGMVLNDCKPSLAAHLTPILEEETGLPVLGYLPPMDAARLPSRHLGLLTAHEIQDLTQRMDFLADQLEKTCPLDRLLTLFRDASLLQPSRQIDTQKTCRIAVARDEAFCFYYQDNLDRLAEQGAELIFFSPLHDTGLPRGTDGLYLGGGYPELYAKALSNNKTMLCSIGEAVSGGVPTIAECGGYLYLQQGLEDPDGTSWPQVGVLDGAGFNTNRLQRFGYCKLQAKADSLLFRGGETIPAHEFHYWDCTNNGSDLSVTKPHSGRSWTCGHVSPTLYAAFPHLHFGGSIPMAQRFIAAARQRHDTNDTVGTNNPKPDPA